MMRAELCINSSNHNKRDQITARSIKTPASDRTAISTFTIFIQKYKYFLPVIMRQVRDFYLDITSEKPLDSGTSTHKGIFKKYFLCIWPFHPHIHTVDTVMSELISCMPTVALLLI